jgi:hypothetical protein
VSARPPRRSAREARRAPRCPSRVPSALLMTARDLRAKRRPSFGERRRARRRPAEPGTIA